MKNFYLKLYRYTINYRFVNKLFTILRGLSGNLLVTVHGNSLVM